MYTRIESPVGRLDNGVYKSEGEETDLVPITITYPSARVKSEVDTMNNINILIVRFFSSRINSMMSSKVGTNIIFYPLFDGEFIYKEQSIVEAFQREVLSLDIDDLRAITTKDYEGYLRGCDLEMRWVMRDISSIILPRDVRVYHDIFFIPRSEEYDKYWEELSMLRSSIRGRVILNTRANRDMCRGLKVEIEGELILVEDEDFSKNNLV